MRAARHIKDKKHVAKRLYLMEKTGMFDNPQTMRARKYKRRIEKFISQFF